MKKLLAGLILLAASAVLFTKDDACRTTLYIERAGTSILRPDSSLGGTLFLPAQYVFVGYNKGGHGTWTLGQHAIASCSGTSCNLTVSAITAGSVLVVAQDLSVSGTMNAPTGDSGTWTHCGSCTTSSPNAGITDAYYTLSASGGETTVTCNLAASAGGLWICGVRELKTTTAASFDAAGNANATPGPCTSCVTETLTLTNGANNAIFQFIVGGSSCTAVNGVYTDAIDSTNAVEMVSGRNTNTGTAPTWTCTSTFANGFGIAFKN